MNLPEEKDALIVKVFAIAQGYGDGGPDGEVTEDISRKYVLYCHQHYSNCRTPT